MLGEPFAMKSSCDAEAGRVLAAEVLSASLGAAATLRATPEERSPEEQLELGQITMSPP